MGAIGDMRAFTMYQAGRSMEKMAEQGGGAGGQTGNAMGMGMGAGFGIDDARHDVRGDAGLSAARRFRAIPTARRSAAATASCHDRSSPARPALPPPRGAAGMAAGAAHAGPDFGDLAPAEASPVDAEQLVSNVAELNSWPVEKEGSDWKLTVPIGGAAKTASARQAR